MEGYDHPLSNSNYNCDFLYLLSSSLSDLILYCWAWSLDPSLLCAPALCVATWNAGFCDAKFNSDIPCCKKKMFNSDIVVGLIIQEFYADFVAIDPYHFTLHVPSNYIYMLPAVVDPSALQRFCDRVVDGLAALFLALKRRPVIRYQRTSDIAKRIAQEASVSSSHII